MNTILICYDLNKAGKDYATLIARIRELFKTRWHHLDSTWIVKTALTPKQIRDDLKGYIDSNDELLVIEHSGAAAWAGFSEDGAQWLRDNL